MNLPIVITKDTVLAPALQQAIHDQLAEVVTHSNRLKDSALAIEIDSQDMADIASDELRTIATAIKKLDEKRLSITRPFDEAKSSVMDMFATPKAALQEGDAHLRKVVSAWNAKQEEIAAEARRKQAEIDRQEREAAAKAQREADEAARAAAEAANQAAAAAAAITNKKQREAAEAAAIQARQAADQAVAQAATVAAAAEEAEVHQAVVAQAPKSAGISTRGKWTVEEADVDMAALVAAAAKDNGLLIYLLPDMKRLRQFATMMKDKAVVPGVKFTEEKILNVRSKH